MEGQDKKFVISEEIRSKAALAVKEVLDAGADLGISINENKIANAVLEAIFDPELRRLWANL